MAWFDQMIERGKGNLGDTGTGRREHYRRERYRKIMRERKVPRIRIFREFPKSPPLDEDDIRRVLRRHWGSFDKAKKAKKISRWARLLRWLPLLANPKALLVAAVVAVGVVAFRFLRKRRAAKISLAKRERRRAVARYRREFARRLEYLQRRSIEHAAQIKLDAHVDWRSFDGQMRRYEKRMEGNFARLLSSMGERLADNVALEGMRVPRVKTQMNLRNRVLEDAGQMRWQARQSGRILSSLVGSGSPFVKGLTAGYRPSGTISPKVVATKNRLEIDMPVNTTRHAADIVGKGIRRGSVSLDSWVEGEMKKWH